MRIFSLMVTATLLFAATACEDPNSALFDPLIQEDTVDLAIPLVDPAIPTALDIAYASSLVRGRFPELVSDAEQWDLAVRREGGSLVLAPAGLYGFRNPVGGESTAGITAPIQRAFDELVEAPGRDAVRTDTAIAIAVGNVYVVRSRRTGASFGGCENYAKLQPLEVDVAAGLVKLRVVGNSRCNDPRLATED